MATSSNSSDESLISTANSFKMVRLSRPKQRVTRMPYTRMRLWKPKRRDPIFPPGFESHEETGENDVSKAMLTYQISQSKRIPLNNKGEAKGRCCNGKLKSTS